MKTIYKLNLKSGKLNDIVSDDYDSVYYAYVMLEKRWKNINDEMIINDCISSNQEPKKLIIGNFQQEMPIIGIS